MRRENVEDYAGGRGVVQVRQKTGDALYVNETSPGTPSTPGR